MDYFGNWGSKENPIRQSDLEALFSSKWGCAKRFAFSRLYPKEGKKPTKLAMGELVHQYIHRAINFQDVEGVKLELGRPDDIEDAEFKKYQNLCSAFVNSPEFSSIRRRKLSAERSFLVQIGKYWCAGTIDLILKGKKPGELVVMDWKSGYPPISQYEMDKGYQSRIYCHAVQSGEFFLRPKEFYYPAGRITGHTYFDSYRRTPDKNKYGVWPAFFFAYLQELLPAQRESSRRAAHKSTEKLAGEDGRLSIHKGERRGPVYYQTDPNTGMKRLEYSMHCAVLMAQSGVFPENIGAHCQTCAWQYRCDRSGCSDMSQKQELLNLMTDLGIEPD